jgi:hypothetical protein
MPELPKVTDFSDLVKHSGVIKAVETFKKIIDYV